MASPQTQLESSERIKSTTKSRVRLETKTDWCGVGGEVLKYDIIWTLGSLVPAEEPLRAKSGLELGLQCRFAHCDKA